MLSGKFCLFSHKNKQHQRYFQFLLDGQIRDIGGAGHDNERFWKLEDHKLKLYSKSEQLTAVFECCYEEVGHSYWEGLHQETIPLEIRIYDSRSDLFDYLTKYTCRYLIDYGALIVGKHTYGIPQLIDYDHGGQVIIGDYCSIGHNVQFITANHDLELITTYPFKSLEVFYTDEPLQMTDDHILKSPTRVGNDVWIGNNAQIMAGVTIGDGAVIAAGALVTKDVEPYAVVGGNPAKVIRYRIAETTLREQMLEIAWWNWPEDIISERLDKIMSKDISGFIKEYLPNAGKVKCD